MKIFNVFRHTAEAIMFSVEGHKWSFKIKIKLQLVLQATVVRLLKFRLKESKFSSISQCATLFTVIIIHMLRHAFIYQTHG